MLIAMPSVEAGIPIICCCITTFFSGSYNSAFASSAKDMILEDHPDAKITVINSLQNSAFMSLFVYEAMCKGEMLVILMRRLLKA